MTTDPAPPKLEAGRSRTDVGTGWTWVGLALALLGPGAIALLWGKATGAQAVTSARASAPWLAAFALLVAAVAGIARCGEDLGWAALGFAGTSVWSVPLGGLLALFFILVFGPLAGRALAASGLGGFEPGQRALAGLPTWYLAMTVVVVAAGEEWLYRGYAIGRLEALTGSAALAGLLSLAAFVAAHLPLWGLGAALSTVVSGGILTAVFLLWRDVSLLIVAHVATDLCGLLAAPKPRGPARP
ncbi:CPBP family intramembrane glutamic endopeptidase [Xanthobacter sp. KR7-225]|uniref:CPBP family intramembrane glutamic endopeptidase n=1 Tax=Xanthobacter sp. KR7-225 TaxID=3156613 RepID=UPI0032B3E06B